MRKITATLFYSAKQLLVIALVLSALTLLLLAQIKSGSQSTLNKPPDIGKITVRLPPTRRFDIREIDPDKTVVDTQVYKVQTRTTVDEMLRANGILPDTNSRSLIYDLNPDIDDINTIMLGNEILLPGIEAEDPLSTAFKQFRYRVSLIRDPTPTQGLTDKKMELSEVTSKILNINLGRFDFPTTKEALSRALNNSQASLDIINSNRFPVSKKVLLQATVEARMIVETLNTALSSEQQLAKALLKTIQRQADSLTEKEQDIKAGKSGMVRTEIRTIQEDNLRVWYAPTADPTARQDCSDLSSPTIEAIARGEYIFWATRGRDNPASVTDEVVRTIRKDTRDIAVELKVLR